MNCGAYRWERSDDGNERVDDELGAGLGQTDRSRVDTLALVGIAAIIALVHVLTNGRYGFHRDELQFLSDARHLDWGFVPYPPFTPFVERIALSIFGLSMVGLRLFSVIAQAAAIVVTGLMARELGGGRLAQVAAALGGRALDPAAVRRHGISIHDLRLFVVGADCLFRDSPAEDGESALVAGDRRDRSGLAFRPSTRWHFTSAGFWAEFC